MAAVYLPFTVSGRPPSRARFSGKEPGNLYIRKISDFPHLVADLCLDGLDFCGLAIPLMAREDGDKLGDSSCDEVPRSTGRTLLIFFYCSNSLLTASSHFRDNALCRIKASPYHPRSSLVLWKG